jgi:hypothetical protein
MPLFGLPVLQQGAAGVREAWAVAGRPGQPRVATGRYFSLGEDADAVADDYIRTTTVTTTRRRRADTLTTTGRLRAELAALRDAGATDVLLYPASSGPEQIGLLAEALRGGRVPAARRPPPRVTGPGHRRPVPRRVL